MKTFAPNSVWRRIPQSVRGGRGFSSRCSTNALKLTQYCLYRFSRITRIHHLIERISLRIQHYLTCCEECYRSFSDSEYIIFDKATALHIERLLAILNTWQRNPSTDIQRLTLELIIDYKMSQSRTHTGQYKLGIDPQTLETYKYTDWEQSPCTTYKSLVEQQYYWWLKGRSHHSQIFLSTSNATQIGIHDLHQCYHQPASLQVP
jgi:hypothetical protein